MVIQTCEVVLFVTFSLEVLSDGRSLNSFKRNSTAFSPQANYNLASAEEGFKGEVYLCKNIQHLIKIDTLHYCKEQHLEICAIQLETKSVNLIILY
jgi:hypothetical protein